MSGADSATRCSLKRGHQDEFDVAICTERPRRSEPATREVILTVEFDYDSLSDEDPVKLVNFQRCSETMRALLDDEAHFESANLILPSARECDYPPSLRDSLAENLYLARCLKLARHYSKPDDLVIFNLRTSGIWCDSETRVCYLTSGEYEDPWELSQGAEGIMTATKIRWHTAVECFEKSDATVFSLVDGCFTTRATVRATIDHEQRLLEAAGWDRRHSVPGDMERDAPTSLALPALVGRH